MTTSPHFIPADDSSKLTQDCKTTLHAALELIGTLNDTLPAEKQQALADLLNSGGRIGLELTLDRFTASTIALIAVELEGARHSLATVHHKALRPMH